MSRIYANENFPLPAVEALRDLGHDVLTTLDSGKSGQAVPDEEVLAFAIETERILITLNRKHFIHLHNKNPNHHGVIVCSVDADFHALANRIHAVLELYPNMAGRLIRINRPA